MANLGKGFDEIDWICDNARDVRARNYDRYCDWFAYNQDMKSMEAEVAKVSTVRNQLGWSKSRLFKRIASMPLHIFYLMKKIDPEFATNSPGGKKKLLRFIMRRPEFGVH